MTKGEKERKILNYLNASLLLGKARNRIARPVLDGFFSSGLSVNTINYCCQ